MVDGSGNGYLKTACDYVHLNPARAKLLRPEQPLSDFVWSSYRQYLGAPSSRRVWLRVDRLLGEWGIPKDSRAGRRVFGERMERRREEGAEQEFRPLERGWRLGDGQFRRELLEQVRARAKITSDCLAGGRSQSAGMPRTPNASRHAARPSNWRSLWSARRSRALSFPLCATAAMVSKC